MKRPLLEVREFDKITAHADDVNGLKPEAFAELEAFVREYTSDEREEDASAFFRIGYQRDLGSYIRVNNYVGLIQLKSGQQIQILPKIDFGTDAEATAEQTKRVFLRMLRSLKTFPGKTAGTAHLDVARLTIFEWFIRMYVQAVWQLLHHGLKSAYLRQEGNLPFCKGKLVMREHIKRNAAHQERFFVAYDEYHQNRAENRLVKSTLLKLLRETDSAETQREIRQQLSWFEAVEPSDNYARDFSRIVFDRSTRVYEELLQWSEVFLYERGFTTFRGEHAARALLFPMEKVYEAHVARELARVLANKGWRVTAQDHSYALFDEPRPPQFALRPDIVIRCGSSSNSRRIVLDTKWKRLDPQKQNFGIAQTDMYQMYVYAKKYHARDVWLLYPQTEELREPEGQQGRLSPFQSMFQGEAEVTVHMFFVDVADIKKSLQKLRKHLEDAIG